MMLVKPSADSGSALKVLIALIVVLIAWMFKPGVVNWYMMQKYKMKKKRALAQQKTADPQ